MLNVALTGNVASGKSTVAHLFQEWGAALIDSDEIVHALQRPGKPVFESIVDTFGPDVVDPSGELDRERLRTIVMSSQEQRERLNAIVHPAVMAERSRLEEAARERGETILVSDIPLLFEVADPEAFDAVILVDADPAVRHARLVEIRGLDPAEASRLMAAQGPAGPKRERADYVIDNEGTHGELEHAAREVWLDLEARAAGSAA